MNSPLPSQSIGTHFLEVEGPADKNALIAGIVGGTPDVLRGTDPFGYAQDTITSWLTGSSLSDTPSVTSPVDEQAPATGSRVLTRIGVGVLAIVLIGIGVYWAVKA